jgi:hypothetical protein
MSFKHTKHLTGLLTNRVFLNVVFIVSLLNLIGYLSYGNLHAVILFILIAGIVGHFSKNMTVVLLCPLVIVNLFFLKRQHSFSEGLENNEALKKKEASNKAGSSDTDANKKVIAKINGKASTKQGLPITPIEPTTTTDDTTTTDESFEVGRSKKGGYDIDYASTVEDAYDQLNSIIGGDGIQRLTSDTQKLMKQQMQLAEAMKGMGPMMESMGPMMQSIGPMMKQAQDILGGASTNNLADKSKEFKPSA